MKNLLIEQRGPSGLLKTWRLSPEQGSATFGNSKHADLRSPSAAVKGIQGIFEFREDRWFYISLNQEPGFDQNQTGEETIELNLESPVKIQLGTTTHLIVAPYEARTPLFAALEHADFSKPGPGRDPFQLYVAFQGSVLLETKVLRLNRVFISKFDPQKTKFSAEKVDGWKKTRVGDLEISQRTVFLKDEDELSRISPGQYIDAGGKKTIVATAIGTLLLFLLFLIAPKNDGLKSIIDPVPSLAFKDITIAPPVRKKKADVQQAEKSQQVALENQTDKNQTTPAAKNTNSKQGAASQIKNLSSGRISQLIGKVSAQAAKSANVVVATGATAGSIPTGRALSAVGRVGKSGKDWAAEGKGSGITVSTKGKAGGQGLGGIGNLATGKTGTGGVGLLEEEGEIVGGLDREIISQYIKSQLGQILYCYERQLSANPELYGKVAIKFTIAGDGTVETQRVGESTLKNATVEGCILQKVARWKFPTPEGGTKVMVTYPFLFKSTN